METIEFDGKNHRCGVFGETFLMDVHAKSWISPIGMLKAEIEYGPTSWTDSLGNILDTGSVRDDYRPIAINPSEARIAKEKADLAQKFLLIGPEPGSP